MGGAVQDSNAVTAAGQRSADASDTSSTSTCEAATKLSAGMETTPDNVAKTARTPKVARKARIAYTAVLTTASLGAMHTAAAQQVEGSTRSVDELCTIEGTDVKHSASHDRDDTKVNGDEIDLSDSF